MVLFVSQYGLSNRCSSNTGPFPAKNIQSTECSHCLDRPRDGVQCWSLGNVGELVQSAKTETYIAWHLTLGIFITIVE